MGRLTQAEYTATISGVPRRIRLYDGRIYGFRPYLENLPDNEWQGHDFGAGTVTFVYDMGGKQWRHIMVDCPNDGVKLVVVVSLITGRVRGHYVLDLAPSS
ncbi:MAG: hypothetical protein QOF57_1802 [Frankiaceae bacterium]|nr:hypothetical protein [Frankiaceae bacterium]MDQ1726667.1 hypothetical protein [Frankiaceae bacterium]